MAETRTIGIDHPELLAFAAAKAELSEESWLQCLVNPRLLAFSGEYSQSKILEKIEEAVVIYDKITQLSKEDRDIVDGVLAKSKSAQGKA